MSHSHAHAEVSSLLRVEVTSCEALLEAISEGNVYAILDACDDPAVQEMVQKEEIGAISLYHGAAVTKFAKLAPYLCKVDHQLFTWIDKELGDHAWGYYIVVNGTVELADLRRHFRKFLLVRGPDGKELYFRFYDPRVIKTFLRTSSLAEALEFVGQIREFIIPEKQRLIKLSLNTIAE